MMDGLALLFRARALPTTPSNLRTILYSNFWDIKPNMQVSLPAVAPGMNTITASYISSGLEIVQGIPDSTETIVECHKLARFLLWMMASIHVQVG
jgi:hypothetical protein